MEYKITARRYSESGTPICAEHSTVVDTEKAEYLEGAGTEKEVCKRYESFWNVPQEDNSRIKVDSIEKATHFLGYDKPNTMFSPISNSSRLI